MGYCSAWCYAIGTYTDATNNNIYAVIPDAAGCSACSTLPPTAG